jgi:hypothetical protein
MSLSRMFARVAAFFGYVPTIDLAAPGESGPAVRRSTRAIFNGCADPYPVYHIDGASLAEKGRYRADRGLIIVDGDVPSGARLSVDEGRLIVTGNVGPGARLSATVPEDTHTRTTMIPVWNGKTMTITPIIQTIFDGYTHNDPASALTVGGDVGRSARLSSNHGIDIGGDIENHVDLNHTRDTPQAAIHTGDRAKTALKAALSP